MSEWGVTPEYINQNWTDEILTLMFEKRNARIRALMEPKKKRAAKPKRMSDTELFAALGVTVRKVRTN